MKKHILCLLAMTIGLASCEKEKITADPVKTYEHQGKVAMQFRNKVGGQDLELETTVYINPNGDQFKVTRFNYFISNVSLNAKDGKQYREDGSFHRVEQIDVNTLDFMLHNVPNGTYTSVTFMIGVDSIKNFMDMRRYSSGSDDMVVSKEEGYMMVNMEGIAPVSNQPNDMIKYHIAGAGGLYNVLHTVTLQFPKELVVNDNTPKLTVGSDILKMFDSPYLIDFITMPVVNGLGENATIIARNYQDMFSVIAAGE